MSHRSLVSCLSPSPLEAEGRSQRCELGLAAALGVEDDYQPGDIVLGVRVRRPMRRLAGSHCAPVQRLRLFQLVLGLEQVGQTKRTISRRIQQQL